MNSDVPAAFSSLPGLEREHRSRLAELTTPVRFAAGQSIFRENQAAMRCWLLGTGSVDLTTVIPGKGAVTLETLHGGDVLGWSWLNPHGVWQFTATATSDTDAAELDIVELERMVDDEPGFAYAVTRALSGVLIARLQSTRARLLDLYASGGRSE
ncbi:crotonobetainyl-CoA--carnitine CoA-transferase [Rhodococcus sp. WMMA185]|uniref:cyclic nucleotide-binding domain-containing protein n=1 Tax=Rhodococcus sp. WMMA185 TaxID=679318 RepID=UPI0008783AD8|nr:cyclic nucleotide-binding domain-containing protein [Rhodococcus sp. WMMA185]AOW92646.1 crotonobetainyl-CoA--carnitine CoA-transferase [Rhodococcus sp. WMMA185]